jgi:hypothetical protein
MARVTPVREDEAGVVYLEFLLAIVPVLLLFFAICQLALLTTAGAVVRHAAYRAARSAIVVLEDDPEHFDGAARGDTDAGDPKRVGGLAEFLGALPGVGPLARDEAGDEPTGGGKPDPALKQRGARMRPIRAAAYLPLLVLAPDANPSGAAPSTLEGSLSAKFVEELPWALTYTQSATVVTLHTRPGTETLAPTRIPYSANVTVRVSYLYPCSVPIVRTLMCSTLASLVNETDPASPQGKRAGELAKRLALAEQQGALQKLGADTRFFDLRAEITLPNQGAAYEQGAAP